MNNTYFNLKVNSIPAGQFFKMAYVSDVTLSALGRKAGVSVLKRVIGTYRIGVNYKHTKKAIAKAAEKNIPIDTASKLPWGQWKDNSNRIICHTNKRVSIMNTSVCMIRPISPRSSIISMESLFLRKTFARLVLFLIVISRLPMRLVV